MERNKFEQGEDGRPAVIVHELRVIRGGRLVLRDISLTLAAGRITGLLGPNGSGKTTLLRSIVGSQTIAAGTVEVLGLPAGNAPLRRRLGYVTQAPSVYGDLTIRENLSYFARVLDAPPVKVEEVIKSVALTEHGGALVRDLSGGERARVSLAAALLGDPELLVLDEPTAGLDPLLRREMWSLFGRMASSGTTVLVSSHVMDEAERCDQLLLLDEGRLVASDTPAGLRARTSAPDVESAFLRLLEGQPV